MAIPRYSNARARALAKGYRSGLEERIACELEAAQVPVLYEVDTIQYTQPAKVRKYTPDFKLPNGMYIETKGRFLAEDRMKHLLIQEQHPQIDIRFVFSNSRSPITKGSKTSYADWCNKNGFKFADKHIPMDWIFEQRKETTCPITAHPTRKNSSKTKS